MKPPSQTPAVPRPLDRIAGHASPGGGLNLSDTHLLEPPHQRGFPFDGVYFCMCRKDASHPNNRIVETPFLHGCKWDTTGACVPA